jgi:hypothetical protein
VIFIALILLSPLLGCDQVTGNRYEITKDQGGRTLRLDRRTGEIAVIDGNEIRLLKDAAQASAERAARTKRLEQVKPWPSIDIPQIGARASLSTGWRDGKMFYDFTLFDLQASKDMDAWIAAPKDQRGPMPKPNPKKRHESLTKAGSHSPFTVKLEDANRFEIVSFTIGPLTQIVDESGLTQYYEEKSRLAVTAEDYERLSTWAVNWR